MLAREVPVSHERLLVQLGPFEHEPERALRHRSGDRAAVDLYGHLVVAVGGVEVGRLVIAVVEKDDDAEEAGDGWH